MSLALFARKFQRNVQDYGWWISIRKVFAHFFRSIYGHQIYRLYRIDLDKGKEPVRIEADGLTFRILNGGDDRAIQQIENAHEWFRGELKETIKSGALCLTAFDGDSVAAFNLIGFGEVFMPLVHKKRTFQQKHAWSEHIAVDKEYRQRGLGAQLRYKIFEELRSRGYTRLYGAALTSNIASLKLARKVGFREIVDLHYICVLGRDFWRYKRVKQ